MKYLVFLLAVVPICAIGDAFGDLLSQEFQYSSNDHLREKRQARDNIRPLGQAPAYIQHLLQSQIAHQPLVSVPPQNVPKLNFPPPAQQQVVPQSQISQYRPQVINSSPSQQPSNPQYNRPIPQQPQPQYRPNYAQPQSQPQQLLQPNYNRPVSQYSSNLPPHLQQLRQYQNSLSS